MDLNFLALSLAALIPLALHFLWYSPVLAGRVVSVGKLSDRPATPGRAALRIVLLVVLGALLTFAVMPMVIHQMHIYSIMAGQPQAEVERYTADLMAAHGRDYRTFKHGAFHGVLASIMLVLPVLGISAIGSRTRAKVVLAHWGYWVLTLALVGGVVCGWAF